MNLYTIEADHAGKYASKLEQEWAVWFDAQSRKHFGSWDEHYIGDTCDYADFEVDGVKIEGKPEGKQFVEMATSRGPVGLLIVEGRPVFARWWIVEMDGLKIARLLNYPLPRETMPDFLKRVRTKIE